MHNKSPEATLKELKTGLEGLSEEEAKSRLASYGYNLLKEGVLMVFSYEPFLELGLLERMDETVPSLGSGLPILGGSPEWAL